MCRMHKSAVHVCKTCMTADALGPVNKHGLHGKGASFPSARIERQRPHRVRIAQAAALLQQEAQLWPIRSECHAKT